MGSHDLTNSEKLKRFLYTSSLSNGFSTAKKDKYLLQFVETIVVEWVNDPDFTNIITSASDDTLLARRTNIFYILARILRAPSVPENVKTEVKNLLFKIIKTDEDFFDFIKVYTFEANKKKFPTTLRKIVTRFYLQKTPLELAKTVSKQESYHGWTHKDLFKLCHLKVDNPSCEPVINYVLFGVEKLPDSSDEVVSLLKRSHDLRKADDVKKAAELITELHATVDQVNSKWNKTEEVWEAAIPEMSTRQILQHLFKIYKHGFLRNTVIQHKINESLTNPQKIKESNLHPVEIFIYMKIFEAGGKPLDHKLIEYLHKREIKEETLLRLTTPNEPKCKALIHNINKCLKVSYNNVQSTGKKYLVTIDVTEKMAANCHHNPRIGCFEATYTIVRYLQKMEKSVTVAVFKDNQINFIDLGKSHAAVDKLKEHKANYILQTAPIDWARNKKKQVDVFINFMACGWDELVPKEIKQKMEKLSEALKKYTTKLKSPDTKVVRFFMGGHHAADSSKNILTITGFSLEVPRTLDAFCKGHFC